MFVGLSTNAAVTVSIFPDQSNPPLYYANVQVQLFSLHGLPSLGALLYMHFCVLQLFLECTNQRIDAMDDNDRRGPNQRALFHRECHSMSD